MPFILGLTGSIGMGKSTTAGFFREIGIPVWDADVAVHELYKPGAKGTEALKAICPEAVTGHGVDRKILKETITENSDVLTLIEAAIHPLVAENRAGFLARAADEKKDIVVCDIPLLFETGADKWCDAVLVVSAPESIQAQRVLDRLGMTKETLDILLSKQMPDADKKKRADFVFETNTLDAVRDAVNELIRTIRKDLGNV